MAKKITQADAVKHFESLVQGKAIYLWGANCETITPALCTKLYNAFHSNTYNKAYYDNKLKEGKGRIGADCSGSFCPLSKADNTAAGYYKLCTKKGSISSIPAGEVVAVFNAKLTHIGLYCGNGYTIEMKSSKDNVHKEVLNKKRWAYYGYLNFIDYSVPYSVTESAKNSGTASTVKVADKYISAYQDWLNKTYGCKLKVDGFYGDNTLKETVKIIQIIYNSVLKAENKTLLNVDGDYGPKTRAATPPSNKIIKNEGLVYMILMRIHAKKISIEESIKNGKVVTVWDDNSAICVERYQKSVRGLTVDKRPGEATMYSLFHV